MSSNSGKSIPVSNKFGGAVFMFIASLILGLAGHLIFRIWEFGTEAAHSTGTIDVRYVKYGHGKGAVASPKFQYHYIVSGTPYTTTTTVANETYGQFHVGDSVPIVYLPKDPSDSRLDLTAETQRHWNNIWLVILIGAPAFVFAAFIYRLPSGSTKA